MDCRVTLGCWFLVFVLVFSWLLQTLFFAVVSFGGPGRLQALFVAVFSHADGLQALSSVVVLIMCLFLHRGTGMQGDSFVAFLWLVLIVSGIIL